MILDADARRLADQRLEIEPYRVGDALSARGVRMHAIGGHFGIGENARQHERHQPDAVCGRQPRKDAVKPEGIVQPVERRRLHSAEQHADRSGLRARDDLFEMAFDKSERYPLEAVVRAQGEDEHAGAFDQRCIEPPQAVGSGITPDAGVHHTGNHPRPVEVCLQASRKALQI